MVLKFDCVLFCCLILVRGASVVNGFSPVANPAKVTSYKCGHNTTIESDMMIEVLEKIQQQVVFCSPPNNRSCQDILLCFPTATSGYYQIHAPNGTLVEVYCDMEGDNCGGEGGWMRVASVNMLQSGATCPQGLTQRTISGLNLCGRGEGDYVKTTEHGGGCQSTTFSTLSLQYSQVCGSLRGYQWGMANAIYNYQINNQLTINDIYFDGASFTYGNTARKHIWTFVTGGHVTADGGHECPCNNGSQGAVPTYVGSDYYREAGANTSPTGFSLYPNDTLWDGQQCVGAEAPCCTHPNMPWFVKTLSKTTTENIELRVCADESTINEDTLLQQIEVFTR